MSLDNIQLPPLVLQQLFKDSLVALNTVQPKASIKAANYNYLGSFNKSILLLVEEKEAIHLQDEALAFVIKILTACNLTMQDVAILNISKNSQENYQQINTLLQPIIVLLLGVSPTQIDMPLSFPQFQIQSYNNQTYLFAPSVNTMMPDNELKKVFWNCLKQIFAV
jgi:hypothetical protein